MTPKEQKIFVFVAIGLVIVGIFYSFNSDTVFSKLIEPITPVDWSEVKEREIVKNSIPITLLEKQNGECKVKGEKFDYIIDHGYFIRSNELADKFEYDRENMTLIVPCEELEGEKSRLNVWYVIPEAPNHSTKYEYFITPWEDAVP